MYITNIRFYEILYISNICFSCSRRCEKTLWSFCTGSGEAAILVYRPLIGFDKADVITLAREIGTFEESTSRETRFKAVPKGPSTKAQLAVILEIERAIEATKMPLLV
jgi:thiamine biosynthesis protein ThiI